MKILTALFASCSLLVTSLNGQPAETVTYKSIDTISLDIQVYYPKDHAKDNQRPAAVFFFGGGWVGGTPEHFKPQAELLAVRGMVSFLVDYRTQRKHGTTPVESLMDAKSAMRYIRANATKFGIDPKKIAAGGGSAGGHLAAATALIQGFNEPDDDLTIGCVPNALLLFNPVIDNGPGGYGYERVGNFYQDFSPLHNIRKGAPPTLFLVGTQDKLIPVETAKYYQTVMEKVGSRCELILYDGAGHGFFNVQNPEYHQKTLKEMVSFLESLDYL